MNLTKVKKVIKGVAKTTGKYTLKGIGKGVELVGRGAVKTVHALVKDKNLQKISTGAGLLAASVVVPEIGAGLIGILGIKYVLDNSLLGKNKKLENEVAEMFEFSNSINTKISKSIISPILTKAEKGIKDTGTKYQSFIDRSF